MTVPVFDFNELFLLLKFLLQVLLTQDGHIKLHNYELI